MSDLMVWAGALAALLVFVLLLVITWSVWRMTVAHERIEHHVSSVERHLAAYLQSRPPT